MNVLAAPDIDVREFLRPGDRIVIGQACGEPTTLIEALIAQGNDIGDLTVFVATSFSGIFSPRRQAASDCRAWARSARCGR